MPPSDANDVQNILDRHLELPRQELTFEVLAKILEFYVKDETIYLSVSQEALRLDYLAIKKFVFELPMIMVSLGPDVEKYTALKTTEDMLVNELVPALMDAATTFTSNVSERPRTNFNRYIFRVGVASHKVLTKLKEAKLI